MSKSGCEKARKAERKFVKGAKTAGRMKYIRTEFNKFRKGHPTRAKGILSAIARVKSGKTYSTDIKDVCDAAKRCMDYERELLRIVGCANTPCFTDYEKWRGMYLEAIEALGFREAILNDKKHKGMTIELQSEERMRRDGVLLLSPSVVRDVFGRKGNTHHE